MPDPTLPERKARLRAEALARRDALDPAWRADASRRACEHALALPELDDADPVSGFWPIRSEIDIRPVLVALHARGRRLGLPAVAKPAMVFRRWAPGDPVRETGFGLTVPLPDAPLVSPRLLLVPLAAFDRRGGRIGYGRGHYDAAIATLAAAHPVVAVGVAFSVQEVPEVPLEPHDRLLDLVVTESGLVRPSQS
jgi:5-formyltetrahydrofolate cyclo-ligase